MIIISKFWTKIFSLGTGIGVVVFPFIFFSESKWATDKEILNHEKIHQQQILELLIFPFYLWYFTEYFIRFLHYRKRQEAYMHISFEKESYANQSDLGYLSRRRFWSFLRYL